MKKTRTKIIISIITVLCLIGIIGGVAVIAGSMGYKQTPMPEIVEPTRRTLDSQAVSQAKVMIKQEDDQIYAKMYELRKDMDRYQPSNPDDFFELDTKNIQLDIETRDDVKYVNLGKVIDIVARAGYCESDLYKPLAEGEIYDICYDENATTTFGGDQDKICNFTIACCNTLNDQSVELTPVEVVRLQTYIREKLYALYGGWTLEETSKSIATCDLIRQTLPEDPLEQVEQAAQ